MVDSGRRSRERGGEFLSGRGLPVFYGTLNDAAIATRPVDAGGGRRRWAIVALAWNNLLSVSSLNGYSTLTLDQLVACHGFPRVALEVDTLMTFSNQQTTSWGRWEERVVKFTCGILAGNRILSPSFRTMMNPWLDVYYAVGQDAVASPPIVYMLNTLVCHEPSAGRFISMRGMVVCMSESDTNAHDPDRSSLIDIHSQIWREVEGS